MASSDNLVSSNCFFGAGQSLELGSLFCSICLRIEALSVLADGKVDRETVIKSLCPCQCPASLLPGSDKA